MIKAMFARFTLVNLLWMLIKPDYSFWTFPWIKRNEEKSARADVWNIQLAQPFLNELFPEKIMLYGLSRELYYPPLSSLAVLLWIGVPWFQSWKENEK